jgi:hypothetical protein
MTGMRRMGALLVMLLTTIPACTGTPRPGAARATPSATSTSAGPVYKVVSSVQIAPDGVAVLCGPGQTTVGGRRSGGGSPPPCGRIRVMGMPGSGVPGSRVQDGYTTTPALLLAGRWHEDTLTLVRAPKPTDRFWQVDLACAADPQPGEIPPDRNIARRIADDRDALRALGTDVYSISTCGGDIFVTVPVADEATKALFSKRYGPTVTIYGWLRTAA